MAITYLKQVETRPAVEGKDIRGVVAQMLAKIEEGGEAAVRDYARDLDGWAGDIVVTAAERAAASARVSQELKDDIRFAHANIRRFAEAQKATMGDCEIEIMPGLIAGQKQIPVSSAGCDVPGGRYSHIASALMTITTAKVAGVPHITACSPTRPGIGIPDPIIFAMDLCGADLILSGHLHIWHAGTFAHPAPEHDGHLAIQLHAGTSLSSRQRGEPNDFNLIDISPLHVNLARISFDDGKKAFTKAEARQFDRASGEFVL